MNKSAAIALTLWGALGAAGCVSLLPKTKPVQLYDLPTAASSTAPAPAGARVNVALSGIQFGRAAAGDRLLTVDGAEAAYIAGARWVSPAEGLFADRLSRAFQERARATRLIGRVGAVPAPLALSVDVNDFEARYESGRKAPVVVVSFVARMVRYPERTVVAEQVFEARSPASDNRVGAIVQAYGQAVDQTLDQLVAWTDAQAGGGASR